MEDIGIEEYPRWSLIISKTASETEYLRGRSWLIISIQKEHYKVQDIGNPNYTKRFYKEHIHAHYKLSLRNILKKL